MPTPGSLEVADSNPPNNKTISLNGPPLCDVGPGPLWA
jgi:hypothetical protein